MNQPPILRSMTFDADSMPDTVTVTLTADLLFDVARTLANLSQAALRPQAVESVIDFRNWASSHVANRFYEDGLDDQRAVLKYNRTFIPVTVAQTAKDLAHMTETLRAELAVIRREDSDSREPISDDDICSTLAKSLYESGARFSTLYTEDD